MGEIGLDYYYSADNKQEQQDCFAQQIEISANEFNKAGDCSYPFCRERIPFGLLQQHHAERCGGVIHCFTENRNGLPEQALALGFYISVSGIITFKNAEDIRDPSSAA